MSSSQKVTFCVRVSNTFFGGGKNDGGGGGGGGTVYILYIFFKNYCTQMITFYKEDIFSFLL
jgi:hypothetical protein